MTMTHHQAWFELHAAATRFDGRMSSEGFEDALRAIAGTPTRDEIKQAVRLYRNEVGREITDGGIADVVVHLVEQKRFPISVFQVVT